MKYNKSGHNIQLIENGGYFNEKINDNMGENKFLERLPIRKKMQRQKSSNLKIRNYIMENYGDDKTFNDLYKQNNNYKNYNDSKNNNAQIFVNRANRGNNNNILVENNNRENSYKNKSFYIQKRSEYVFKSEKKKNNYLSNYNYNNQINDKYQTRFDDYEDFDKKKNNYLSNYNYNNQINDKYQTRFDNYEDFDDEKRKYKLKIKLKELDLNKNELLKDNREEKYNYINYKKQVEDINNLNNEIADSQSNINNLNNKGERINYNSEKEISIRKYQDIINKLKKEENLKLRKVIEDLNKKKEELTNNMSNEIYLKNF